MDEAQRKALIEFAAMLDEHIKKDIAYLETALDLLAKDDIEKQRGEQKGNDDQSTAV